MACLDLHYSVTLRVYHSIEEDRDTHIPLVLGDLQEKDSGPNLLDGEDKGMCCVPYLASVCKQKAHTKRTRVEW